MNKETLEAAKIAIDEAVKAEQAITRMLAAAIIAAGGKITIPLRVLVQMPDSLNIQRMDTDMGIVLSVNI